MVRILLCLLVGVGIGITLLMIRQQRLELQYESNKIHDEMLDTQRQLWRQQVQIAAATAPAALDTVLANHEFETEPEDATRELPDEWDVYESGPTATTADGWEAFDEPAAASPW